MTNKHSNRPPTANKQLAAWVQEMTVLCEPAAVHWCDGSDAENQIALRPDGQARHVHQAERKTRPGSYLARSHPSDVARVEDRTFICADARRSRTDEQLGRSRRNEEDACTSAFKGCMNGRTLYVIPFAMGPLDSPLCKIGIEITDSPYVVVNMRIMTRMGTGGAGQARQGRQIYPLHALGRRAAQARPERRSVAVRTRPDEKIHRAFPGRAFDLVLRFRLRRQRAARQEMSRAAHRLHRRRKGRLDGGAHAHPRPHFAEGQKTLRRRGASRAPAAKPIWP